MFEQHRGQRRTTPDDQVRPGLCLCLDAANALDDVRSKILDRPLFKTLRPVGRDVFRRRIYAVRHRTPRGFRPEAAPDIVGSTAKQQIESVALGRDNGFSSSRVVMRHRPSAVLEAATGIFLWAARRLNHAVERDMLEDPDRSHKISSSL